jgi:hypothetical protein
MMIRTRTRAIPLVGAWLSKLGRSTAIEVVQWSVFIAIYLGTWAVIAALVIA